MKTFILILSILFVISCNKDTITDHINDDDTISEQNNDEIVATWNLAEFVQFGPIYNYCNEDIQWTFNSDNTVNVFIADGIDVHDNLLLNNSETYVYSIQENGILLEGILYPYEINDNELIILVNGGPTVDGMQLTFEKNNANSQQDNVDFMYTWSIIKHEPGFAPIHIYNNDEIQWTFNNDNTFDALIADNTDVNHMMPIQSSGNYTYSILSNGTIFINSMRTYAYTFINNELILTSGSLEADGSRITLSKCE